MRMLSVGLGMAAGAAVTLLAVDSLYPDVKRRMVRDGKRAVRTAKRTISDITGMAAK